MLVAVCVLVIMPGILARRYAPNATIADLSIGAWAIILTVFLALIPIDRLIYNVAWLGVRFALRPFPSWSAKVTYYGLHMRGAILTFIWMCLALVAFSVVVYQDPFPPERHEGRSIRTDSLLWWWTRIFICGIIVTFFGMPRAYVVAKLGLKVSVGVWVGGAGGKKLTFLSVCVPSISGVLKPITNEPVTLFWRAQCSPPFLSQCLPSEFGAVVASSNLKN